MSALDVLIRRKQAAIVALVETNPDHWLADNGEAMEADYRICADAITGAAAARQQLDQRRGPRLVHPLRTSRLVPAVPQRWPTP